jgi:hypothetical protein
MARRFDNGSARILFFADFVAGASTGAVAGTPSCPSSSSHLRAAQRSMPAIWAAARA